MINNLTRLLEAGQVDRFHTEPTIHNRNIGHHSFNMMLIIDWAYENNPPVEILRAAMLHDMHERYMGDIPYPIKRNPLIEDNLKILESEINKEMRIYYSLTKNQEEILNAADMLEFMWYILQERRLGNTNHEWAFVKANEYLELPRNDRIRMFHKYICKEWEELL